MSDKPGMTEVVCHEIHTGGAPPVRSVPYQIPEKWKEQVREEILALVEQGPVELSCGTSSQEGWVC